ncbi:transcriptional antitermination N peptide [Pectobacterium versatile]|uniref:transcriptional antitermination N peptide n=1 Tax=Pectobacterium versatile TaxID=2488639 RepID=UPI001B395374|nr:hypothetical protein [Pectobacterium versatile]MBQ4777685.1 hypothetical protein [Pectobacterium versatile]
MTTIIVKPAKDNAKRRKYLKTGAYFAQKDADRELAKKISKAWAKLTHVDLPKRSEPEYSGSVCLPQVALFNAGRRKSENVTAR